MIALRLMMVLWLAGFMPAAASETISLTAAETAWLKRHPAIRIAPTPDYEPVEYFDAQGRYTGMIAEYFRLVEKRLGYKFMVVRLSPKQWEQVKPEALGTDIVTCWAWTPKRATSWDFTTNYLSLRTYVLTRKYAEDNLTLDRLSHARVAVVHTWAAEEYLRRDHPDVVVDAVADAATGLKRVSFGLADAFVSELPVATAWMEKEGISNLKVSAEAGFTYRLAFATRNDWPELHSIMEKALATITPAERQRILDQWMKLKTPEERRHEERQQQALWVAAGLALALAWVVAWNRLLVWRIRVQTKKLRESEEKFSKAFHNNPVGKILTALNDGVVLDVNDAFLSMYGFPKREAVIGRTSLELGMWDNPADRVLLAEALRTEKRVLNLKRQFRRTDDTLGTGLFSFELIEIAGRPCVLLIVNDITALEHTAASLAASEAKFAIAFRNSPLAVTLTRLEDGVFLDANEAFLRMHGFQDRSEVMGRSSLELGLWAHPNERRDLLEKLKTRHRVLNAKLTFCRQNGERGTGLYSFERIEIAGVPSLISLINDITEQEKTSQALAASEAKFSLAFRSSPLAVAVTTLAEGVVVDVNNAFLAMHGYQSSAEVIGRRSVDLGMWVNPAERAGLAEKLRKNQRMLNIKRSFRRVDGTVGMGLYSIELVEMGGEPCGLLLVNDITEAERVQAALEQNELRLRLMAELVAGYSFAYTVLPDRTVTLEWLSQAGEKVLGFSEEEMRGLSFRGRVHPDDRAALQAALQTVLAGIPEVTEFRFQTKSGRMRWLQCFNRPEWHAAENRVVRILGAGQDITDRRASQEALRDSIEKTPTVCVQWLDDDGRITYWNRASQTVYGWNSTEAMHKKVGQLMHTAEQETLFDGIIQDIKITGQTFGPKEITFQRRDGRRGTSLTTLFPIPAPADGIIFVRTDIDITELKNAEADRERLLQQLHLAEDAERRRIARELHDSTAQLLAAVKMNLSLLQQRTPELAESLQDSLAITDEAIQEIRNFTWLLHPPLLEELGLLRALTDYGGGFAKRTQIQTVVDTGNFLGRLPAAIELVLFRVAQESLNNILRHAESKTAIVRLERDEVEVRLEIQDAGRGMDVTRTKPGVGMSGMRERLRQVGGSLEIESDQEGTTVLAVVPLAPEVGGQLFLIPN